MDGYGSDFPQYASRMMLWTALIAGLIAVVAVKWGWIYFASVLLGALFQILFLAFLRMKHKRWTRWGKAPDEIGRSLVGYTGARLFFEVGACIGVAIFWKLAVIGFLMGLLSLTLSTLLDKIVDIIKN